MGSSLHEAPAAATRRFAQSLRQRSDAALVALLHTRGDLAVPSPATLRSLAARASSHTSLEHALTRITALELQVVEAVTALPGMRRDDLPAALSAEAVSVSDVGPGAASGPPHEREHAGNATRGEIDAAVETVLTSALIWTDDDGLWPSPGLAELLGPYPAGLAPATTTGDGAGASPGARNRPAPVASRPAGTLADRLRRITPDQRAVLDALTWGPPVGRVPPSATRQRDAVDELLSAHLLTRADAAHVVLSRDVALALRGGRTHRAAALRPVPEGYLVSPATVAAESASAALELVRQVGVLRATWADDPPRALRGGGLGVRELRRLAIGLECDEETTAFVVELAAAADLVADDGEPDPSFVTLDSPWSDGDDADRWAALVRAWLSSRRTSWRAGRRDDDGVLRSVLSVDLERGWVPRLRSEVLRVAGATEHALGTDDVMGVLTWRTPRHAPPREAVDGLLREAARLGVTGAGALGPPGRLLAGDETPDARDLAAALRAILPDEVDELLLQGDLTGVVPGRASRELARLVELTADTESRGAATTVRFSPASVTRALDRGRSADDLLADLARHSPVPVPQPLEYLVRDTARRHGAVRVGMASSYLRAADEVTLAGLERDPALSHLGLVRLAPTVLVAAVSPASLHETLRSRGVVSAVEGPDGRVLDLRRPGGVTGSRRDSRRPHAGRSARATRLTTGPGPDGHAPGATPATRSRPDLPGLVAGLRAADEEARRAAEAERSAGGTAAPSSGSDDDPGAARAGDPASTSTDGGAGTQPPVDGLALLREAVRDGVLVRVDVVGAAGTLEHRTLRPLRLDGGRLRAVDPARDAEITVAVHRIARVAPTEDAS